MGILLPDTPGRNISIRFCFGHKMHGQCAHKDLLFLISIIQDMQKIIPEENRVMGPDRFFSISTYAIKGDQG
jgi:hypothetical protein